jgi:hypothetical protein
MKTTRKHYTTEYKKKTQLETISRGERLDALESAGHDEAEALRILELENELAAAKEKIADLTLANDLQKKFIRAFRPGKGPLGTAS